MGHCETSETLIGARVIVKDLIGTLKDSETHDVIVPYLINGFVEDENGCYNESWKKIINGHLTDHAVDFDMMDWQQLKTYMTRVCQRNGDVEYYRGGGTEALIYEPDNEENLWHAKFLIPFEEIVSCTRWGYDRTGINAVAKPMDFEQLKRLDEQIRLAMQQLAIEQFEVVIVSKLY